MKITINENDNSQKVKGFHTINCKKSIQEKNDQIYINKLFVLSETQKYFVKNSNIGPFTLLNNMIDFSGDKYTIGGSPNIHLDHAKKIYDLELPLSAASLVSTNLPQSITRPNGQNHIWFQCALPHPFIILSNEKSFRFSIGCQHSFIESTFRVTTLEFINDQLLNIIDIMKLPICTHIFVIY